MTAYSDVLKDIEALEGLKLKILMEDNGDKSTTCSPFKVGWCFERGSFHNDVVLCLDKKP